jgi:hypothetical protein
MFVLVPALSTQKGMTLKSKLKKLAPAGLAVMAVAFAPSAAASPDSFLDELNTNNAAIPGFTPGQNIGAGYETCGKLRGGASVLDQMTEVEQIYHFSQGTLFVSAATTNLCPDFAG